MNLRIGFYIFSLATLLSVLSSCLGSSNSEYITSTDAQITAFSLQHDSIPALDSVHFTIDQFGGFIYNYDSMRYGTSIEEKVKVVFTTNAAGILNITNIASNDSAYVSSGDSLDVSSPVHLKVYAYDGSVKYYWVNLNIHKIDPDSIRYGQVAANQTFLNTDQLKSVYLNQVIYTYTQTSSGPKLFRSTDGANWVEINLTGLPADAMVSEIQQTDIGLFAHTPGGQLYQSLDAQTWQAVNSEFPVKAVFGYIGKTPLQEAGLSLLVEKGGKAVFAFTSDFATWYYGDAAPQNFPMTVFSSVKISAMSADRVTIIGGVDASNNVLNSSWSTLNGLYWAKITDDVLGLYPVMRGTSAFIYDSQIYLLNGQFVEDGAYNKSLYYSKDGGTTWQLAPDKTSFPEEYSGRYNSSIVVDKNNYMYIIGGKQEQPLNDVWTGILNKLVFK